MLMGLGQTQSVFMELSMISFCQNFCKLKKLDNGCLVPGDGPIEGI